MAKQKSKPESKGPNDDDYRPARIATDTAEQMRSVLEGRAFQLVGRSPRRAEDGTYYAEVIGIKADLEEVPTDECRIEIRPRQRIKDPEKQVSKTNRYSEEGAVPRGVGVKK